MNRVWGATIFLGVLLVGLGTPVLPAGLRVKKTGPQGGHYLEYQRRPILLIGDSVTQGWMECALNFNVYGYIDALADRGLNVLMLWSFIGTDANRQVGDSRLGYDCPESWPWNGSPDDNSFDLTVLNTDYFDRLSSLVRYAESRGVMVLITVHDGWTKGRFDQHPFNASLGNGPLTSNSQYVELADPNAEMPPNYDPGWSRTQKNQYFQERFMDRLATTLDGFSNVLFEMFNEGEWYDPTLRNLHEQHSLTFFRARTTSLLMTETDAIAGDDPHNDPKVDLISLHGGWDNRFSDFAAGFSKSPPKPYFLSEPVPGWDGNNISLDAIRRSVWNVALAGAGWVNQNDTSFGWDPNTNMAARAGIRDQAYDIAGHAARFFNSSDVNFSHMAPAGNLCSTGICMAEPGVEYVVYAPSGGSFTVNLSAGIGKKFRAQWYNPRTGTFLAAGEIDGGSNAQNFTAPDGNDWVLHLKTQLRPDDFDAQDVGGNANVVWEPGETLHLRPS